MKKFLRKLFCFHSSWAKAAWIPNSSWHNTNYYICKHCNKIKNFGFNFRAGYGPLALPNFPVNFDCTDDTWVMPPELVNEK